MLSRRDMVGRLAAGTAAVVCATGLPRVASAATRRGGDVSESEAGRDPASEATLASADTSATEEPAVPWELLSPLALGSVLANDWSAAGLTGAVDGSCVLTVKNQRGREHRIHLCRNDGTPQGLVHTDRFDLVVMNGGSGDLPTEEGLAQAVAEVAHVLSRNETHPRTDVVLANLLPQAERVRQFSDRRLR